MERAAIREQLERILASPRFKNSKRYPCLLRYVVEHTLEGHTPHLKERSLGVEVFGRDPGYDTNLDPVVRTTAGEIRKRIAQYYHEPGHEGEIRIDLPSGSYVPEFHVPTAAKKLTVAIIPQRRGWPTYLVVVSLLGALTAVGARFNPWASQTALDKFWNPTLDSAGPVLFCVGQPVSLSVSPGAPPSPALEVVRAASEIPVTVQDLHRLGDQHISLADAKTLSRLAGLLQSKGKIYQIKGGTSTTLADLRSGPVVLIGAFNNEWTLHLTHQLRFTFDRDGHGTSWIKDRQNPTLRNWSVDFSMPYVKLTEDYAVISRILDPTTERMIVVVGGITKFGTLAGGEFLTDPSHLEAFALQAPPHWERKNIEIVIATKVINGNYGPPRVLATHIW